jgi:PadR family transcriptional regulator PadR
MKGTNIGEFEELALLVVIILKEEAYVFKIQEEIKQQVNRSVSMGALHSTLTRLEKKGYIDSEMAGASTKRGGRRKRMYQLTASGTKVLQEVKDMRSMLWDQVPSYALKMQHA